MKQTAIDWLLNEISATDWWYLPQSMKQDIIQQAKAMEREQIIMAHHSASIEQGALSKDLANDYYNETFKSE